MPEPSTANETQYDVIIIGAGGAGMMCGIHAGARHRRVLIIDHSEKIGRKILISGGGRCNFTNIHAGPANFHSANPHFAKSALARYTPQDFINLVRKHRIPYHEKKLGQLFCDRTAQDIVDLLVRECKHAGVKFSLATKIQHISKLADGFEINTSKGIFTSESLIVATGGLSIPPIGATGFGYDIAKQFGLKIEDTFPALVGFNFNKQDLSELKDLAGLSFDSVVSCNKASFRENTLITHTGISGPAILQASLYWHPNNQLNIDTCPDGNPETFLNKQRKNKSTKELKNLLAELIPKRLAEKLCEKRIRSKPINQYNDQEIAQICESLANWKITPGSNFGYAKAEVTRGGVSTNELSSKDMMSKKVPRLFFVGEVVDVTGQLGGFNFQWAWASAHAAGTVA